MKTKTIPLFLVLVAAMVAIAEDRSTSPSIAFSDDNLKSYGVKKAGSIEVRIIGTGVAKPGRYYLEEKTTVFVAVQMAEPSEAPLKVLRNRNREKKIEQMVFDFDTKTTEGTKKAKGFALESGDTITVPQPFF